MPYSYVDIPTINAVFVLYANKNNTNINKDNIDQYKVECIPTFGEFLNLPESAVESGIQKVDEGWLDGYITSQDSGDEVAAKFGLKNVKKIHYETFPGLMIVTKNERGEKVGKILIGLVEKLKANGKYDQIIGPLLDGDFGTYTDEIKGLK